MKVGDIIECIKPISKDLYNEEYNIGDKAIIIYSDFDIIFKIRKLDGEHISLFYIYEIKYFKNISNRKSRIENLEL